MEHRGLLFIPDISGFTRFINETEIDHSRLIIQELLEVMVNANQIGLKISEIEGDAILFYRYGDIPDLRELYSQVERMFCEFHKALQAYDNRRYCQCRACVSAIELTVKIITHYGEFTGYNVQQFSKLIGKDIIVAHQLLKNEIPQHEYWLVTEPLLHDQRPEGPEDWIRWMSSEKQTDSGLINFHYAQLAPLKTRIPPVAAPQLEIAAKRKIFTVSREYATDIITLFHAAGDFNYRSRWQEGVRAVEEIAHFLPRVGMRCRCVMEDGEAVIYSSSYAYSGDRIEFSETDEDRKSARLFVLERISDHQTKLSINYYRGRGFIGEWLFRLNNRAKLEASFIRSLEKLDAVAKSIRVPTAIR